VLSFAQSPRARAQLFAELGRWEDALALFASPELRDLDGIMAALRGLARFDELGRVALGAGTFAAAAHWHLLEHDAFLAVARRLPLSDDTRFFVTAAAVMDGRFDDADALLADGRAGAARALFPALGESYERTYADFARVAAAAELADVVAYMRARAAAAGAVQAERAMAERAMADIRALWERRFRALAPAADVLHSALCVRALVLSVAEQRQHFLAFIAAAVDERKLGLAARILEHCRARDPCVEFDIARLRIMFEDGSAKDRAVAELAKLARDPEHVLLLAKWLHERARDDEARQWLFAVAPRAAAAPPLWDAWSTVNFALYLRARDPDRLADALHGVINGLVLAPDLTLTLRLLHIVFKRDAPRVCAVLEAELPRLPPAAWIPVLPQLLSRIACRNAALRGTIATLLIGVGRTDPQAVMLPLMVPLSLANPERRRAAADVAARLAQAHPALSDALARFGAELVRVSSTWWETVVAGVDEADRAVAERNSADEMLELLGRINELAYKAPASFYESAFLRAHAEELRAAEALWHIFRHNRDEASLNALWHHFTTVFYGCRPLVREMHACELEDASPYLAKLPQSEICVPGQPGVRIAGLRGQLDIIDSKQRPRKVAMVGADGRTYTFLLKAHEDTRLDERVMQLFSVINTFVAASQIPLRDRLLITTYKVVPITGEVGLIGWVNDCGTLFEMIRAHRAKHKVELECEYQRVLQTFPNYDALPLREKLRAFEFGLKQTDGMEVRALLLARAVDSAHWLERRTNFTASLAMTSMAGYLLGLGDRHMMNIMMDTRSGKLVHIDFGDCFEVAIHREQFPERVPFRLSRQLVLALELAGIRGTLASACQMILRRVRENVDQILGLLSMFTYDPLHQWGLVDDGGSEKSPEAKKFVKRIRDKLTGNDFEGSENLTVEAQVDMLIQEATDHTNLCQMFKGWYPWW
jgi:FKBP12-rapamycin complex-associated protein